MLNAEVEEEKTLHIVSLIIGINGKEKKRLKFDYICWEEVADSRGRAEHVGSNKCSLNKLIRVTKFTR